MRGSSYLIKKNYWSFRPKTMVNNLDRLYGKNFLGAYTTSRRPQQKKKTYPAIRRKKRPAAGWAMVEWVGFGLHCIGPALLKPLYCAPLAHPALHWMIARPIAEHSPSVCSRFNAVCWAFIAIGRPAMAQHSMSLPLAQFPAHFLPIPSPT